MRILKEGVFPILVLLCIKSFFIKKEKDIRLIVFMGTFNELRYKFHKFVPLGRNE